jgi:hypothetical protein
MQNLAQQIRNAFPTAQFNPPCTEAMLAEAESALGYKILPPFRDLFLAFDGFEATARRPFLFHLLGAENPGSALVSNNEGFRWEWPHLKKYMLFGLNLVNQMWALDLHDQRTIVTIELSDTQDIRSVGTDLLAVYVQERDRHLHAVSPSA